MAVRNGVFLLTAVLSLIIAGLLYAGKLRLGIDFTGGAALELQAKNGDADPFEIAARLTDTGVDVLSVDRANAQNRALVRIRVCLMLVVHLSGSVT